MFDCAADVVTATEHCDITYSTGRAGDVCHPFLVHGAQANHGTRRRFLGQPAILPLRPYRIDRADAECSPVELTIKRSMALRHMADLEP